MVSMTRCRDFMRVTSDIYAIPPERVVGTTNALRYVEGPDGGSIVYLAKPDVFDDGPVKPVRIWSRIGRRPILAFGNSNGDIQMLQFTGGKDRPRCAFFWHDDKAASSTTSPAPRSRSSWPKTGSGRSSASRATGKRCSMMVAMSM